MALPSVSKGLRPGRILVALLILALGAGLIACTPTQTAGTPAPDSAACAAGPSTPLAASLADLDRDPNPWMHMEANSEQRQPVYLGASPREMELGLAPADQGRPLVPDFLKARGERQFVFLREALVRAGRITADDAVELETWPVRDDTGRLTWAVPRWRPAGASDGDWMWVDPGLTGETDLDPNPLLPPARDMALPQDRAKVFADVLEQPGLYDKPDFGDCLWTRPGDGAALPADTLAWLPTVRMTERGRGTPPGPVCRVTPMPARVNGRPGVWRVTVSCQGVAWPGGLAWKPTPGSLPPARASAPAVSRWPGTFVRDYRADVLALDGEREAVFPLSARKVRFTRKNNITPDNQLPLVVEYLEERYTVLGLRTFRQEFTWRGMPQANLIAVIPGSDPEASRTPVLMGDHMDTAFCEDTYEATGQRRSAPGADDNGSATAALLRAAVVLKDSRPVRDIWLAHFTGEEFPADDLGARQFLARIMGEKRDIAGLVLMDLIGWRAKGDPVFQVNPGEGAASLEMAALALDAARSLGAPGRSGYVPVLRPRHDQRSYLYNTDGLIFSDAGFPVVLLNEHMNRLENLNRVGYHHTTDDSRKMDWKYASFIARVAIETAARMAGARVR